MLRRIAILLILSLAAWTHGIPGASSPSSIQLNFATSAATNCSTITSCLSITRATQETCETIGGAITYASAGNACITSEGLQVYQAGTNLITDSQDTTNWSNTGLASFSTGATGPDGNSNAFTLTDDTSSGAHFANISFSVTSGNYYVVSGFFAAGTCASGVTTQECSYGALSIATASLKSGVDFDAANCYILAGNGGGGLTTGSNIKVFQPKKFSYGGKTWCRIGYIALATGTSSVSLHVAMVNGIPQLYTPGPSYTSQNVSGGSTLLAFGVDVKVGTTWLPYCPSSVGTCNADVITASGALKTMLEGSALRVVAQTAEFAEDQSLNTSATAPLAHTILGVVSSSTALTALGNGDGSTVARTAYTNWPVTTGKHTAGVITRYYNTNYFGLSADGSGRVLALNGVSVSDSNGIGASTLECIGSLSSSAACASGSNYCDCVIANLTVWNTRSDTAMVTATNNSNVLAPIASYTGIVANHTRNPTTTSSAYSMSRSHHRAMENITSLQLALANYYHPNAPSAETGPSGTTNMTAGIEYPLGTCTQVLFSGIAEGSTGAVSTLYSDSLSITIPAGQDFWVRVWRNNGNGLVFQGNTNFRDSSKDGLGHPNEVTTISGSDPGDHTTDCAAITSNTGSAYYYPDAIIGPTTQHTYCIAGDSRSFSYLDALDDAEGMLGDVERIVEPYYPVLNQSDGGDALNNYTVANSSPNRLAELAYCSGMFVMYGGNDIFQDTNSAATVEANAQKAYAFSSKLLGGSGGPVWQTTTYTQTTGSDTFTSIAGQTLNSAYTVNDTVNTWIKGNTAAILVAGGCTGCSTYAGNFDLQGGSPVNVFSSAYIPGGTYYWCFNTVVVQSCTQDNLHPTQYANHLMANAFQHPTLQ
jgi:hypothetical protein